jgi:hypothetical protein
MGAELEREFKPGLVQVGEVAVGVLGRGGTAPGPCDHQPFLQARPPFRPKPSFGAATVAPAAMDPDVKAFAQEYLPKIQAHTAQIEQTAQGLTK